MPNLENKVLYRIEKDDNVAVALQDCGPGQTSLICKGHLEALKLKEPIPKGHKAAVLPIGKGAAVIKYGCVIGLALRDIAKGECVNESNLASQAGQLAGGQTFRPGAKTVYTLPVYPRHMERSGNAQSA